MSKPRRRSPHPTSPSAKHNGQVTASPAAPPQTPARRPANDDRDAWKAHWVAQGQLWRTEPEIDQKRQAELEQRRAIAPDLGKGNYPFKGMKLSRADVEWLLATHDAGLGPVNWNKVAKRGRKGLDLRGADLRRVDLSGLPLTRLCGGLPYDEWKNATEEQRTAAGVFLGDADLSGADLSGADLREAQLEGANLQEAQLEGADLYGAQLKGADLERAYLKRACLRAHLEDANLREAHLEDANLIQAQLEGANLIEARLEGADLFQAHLGRADLRAARLGRTHLSDVLLGDKRRIGPRLADVQWGDANLAVVEWSQVAQLCDEYEAHQKETRNGQKKAKWLHLIDYQEAVRANRQLAVALQAQGLNEDAARFIYHAQKLQRIVLRRQRKFSQYLFSLFLSLIAGYGYKLWRSFVAYLLVIVGFAAAYYLIGQIVGPALSPLGAFVFSMTSFHGRGFFPGNNISLDDPLTVLAALEALVGLIIEVTFIATLTQRFFNR